MKACEQSLKAEIGNANLAQAFSVFGPRKAITFPGM